MNDFLKSFNTYVHNSQYDSLSFWAFPVVTIIIIWLFTIAGLKVFTKRNKLKIVFIANRAWMLSALIVAAIIIGFICYWWSVNYFATYPLQLSLLISLTIAMLVPVFCLVRLRNYYSQQNLKEITDQPKTTNQLDTILTFAKNAYRNNKLYYLIPLAGFLLLLFYLNKGTNLISLVYDNSASMTETNAVDALSETFDNLQDNNEVVLTTIDGLDSLRHPMGKASMRELMLTQKSNALYGGTVSTFNNPAEAKNGLTQASNPCWGSPICEAVWKTYLSIKEGKANQNYKKKLLIIITDGMDNIDVSLKAGKFFFDDESFAGYFPPSNVYIIDYSQGTPSNFMQRFQAAGADIYPAENNKEAYLNALDNALQSFKNNWFLIFWTLIIFVLFALIGFFIQPKQFI